MVTYLEQSTALGNFLVGRTTVLDGLQGTIDNIQSSASVALFSLSVETEQTSITVRQVEGVGLVGVSKIYTRILSSCNTHLNHPSVGLHDIAEETRAATLTRAESQRVYTTADDVLQNGMCEPIVARDSSSFVNNGEMSSAVSGQTEFATTDVFALRFGLLYMNALFTTHHVTFFVSTYRSNGLVSRLEMSCSELDEFVVVNTSTNENHAVRGESMSYVVTEGHVSDVVGVVRGAVQRVAQGLVSESFAVNSLEDLSLGVGLEYGNFALESVSDIVDFPIFNNGVDNASQGEYHILDIWRHAGDVVFNGFT